MLYLLIILTISLAIIIVTNRITENHDQQNDQSSLAVIVATLLGTVSALDTSTLRIQMPKLPKFKTKKGNIIGGGFLVTGTGAVSIGSMLKRM